jgi:hypothetical protein
MKKISALLLLFLLSVGLTAQQNDNAVNSIDRIVNEVLNIISGDPDKVRDWEAFRNLFDPDATISFLQHDSSGNNIYHSFSLNEFVEIGKNNYSNNSFLEYEITKTVDEYNGIAHVFQVYYAKGAASEEKGINSYQLIHDGNRWWITSILWTDDTNGVEVPRFSRK